MEYSLDEVSKKPTPQRRHTDFDLNMLPNFCTLRTVVATLGLAVLGAVLLAVMRSAHHPAPFYDFLTLSALMCACVLIWVAGLCFIRGRIERWGEARILGCGFISAILMGYIGGELSYFAAVTYPEIADAAHIARSGHILRAIVLSSTIGFVALYYLRVHFRLQKNARAMVEAKTQGLQARIRPHFLFNTLNTIAELTCINPEDAETAIYDLARLYRMSLSDVRAQTTLAEELETCRAYVSIEQYRMGDRLTMEWDIADSLSQQCSLPALTLQPLVENAMYHGIEPRPDGGVVKIKGSLLPDGRVEISVTNPLPGRDRSNRHKGNNIALDNIRQRFELIFGDGAELFTEKIGGDFYAAIRFPHNE
ncbi:MAG: two-component system sensor histidine kinase AlgZ [Gammaproteobacteria bacterium]|jgi:two-component system sensor histidine kinase AlgZ